MYGHMVVRHDFSSAHEVAISDTHMLHRKLELPSGV